MRIYEEIIADLDNQGWSRIPDIARRSRGCFCSKELTRSLAARLTSLGNLLASLEKNVYTV